MTTKKELEAEVKRLQKEISAANQHNDKLFAKHDKTAKEFKKLKNEADQYGKDLKTYRSQVAKSIGARGTALTSVCAQINKLKEENKVIDHLLQFFNSSNDLYKQFEDENSNSSKARKLMRRTRMVTQIVESTYDEMEGRTEVNDYFVDRVHPHNDTYGPVRFIRELKEENKQLKAQPKPVDLAKELQPIAKALYGINDATITVAKVVEKIMTLKKYEAEFFNLKAKQSKDREIPGFCTFNSMEVSKVYHRLLVVARELDLNFDTSMTSEYQQAIQDLRNGNNSFIRELEQALGVKGNFNILGAIHDLQAQYDEAMHKLGFISGYVGMENDPNSTTLQYKEAIDRYVDKGFHHGQPNKYGSKAMEKVAEALGIPYEEYTLNKVLDVIQALWKNSRITPQGNEKVERIPRGSITVKGMDVTGPWYSILAEIAEELGINVFESDADDFIKAIKESKSEPKEIDYLNKYIELLEKYVKLCESIVMPDEKATSAYE